MHIVCNKFVSETRGIVRLLRTMDGDETVTAIRRILTWGHFLMGRLSHDDGGRRESLGDERPTPATRDELARLDSVARSASKSLDCWQRSRPDLFRPDADADAEASVPRFEVRRAEPPRRRKGSAA